MATRNAAQPDHRELQLRVRVLHRQDARGLARPQPPGQQPDAGHCRRRARHPFEEIPTAARRGGRGRKSCGSRRPRPVKAAAAAAVALRGGCRGPRCPRPSIHRGLSGWESRAGTPPRIKPAGRTVAAVAAGIIRTQFFGGAHFRWCALLTTKPRLSHDGVVAAGNQDVSAAITRHPEPSPTLMWPRCHILPALHQPFAPPKACHEK